MSGMPKAMRPEPLMLTPELHARLHRMAVEKKQTLTRTLCDIVEVEWVRYACARSLGPED